MGGSGKLCGFPTLAKAASSGICNGYGYRQERFGFLPPPWEERLESLRVFECLRCRRQMFVCRFCDRGYRYCSDECGTVARKEQTRRSQAAYLRDDEGRETHRLNQWEYRKRKKAAGCVIDQSSKNIQIDATIVERPEEFLGREISPEDPIPEPMVQPDGLLRCFICGGHFPPYVRRSFLTSPEFARKPFCPATLFRRRIDWKRVKKRLEFHT